MFLEANPTGPVDVGQATMKSILPSILGSVTSAQSSLPKTSSKFIFQAGDALANARRNIIAAQSAKGGVRKDLLDGAQRSLIAAADALSIDYPNRSKTLVRLAEQLRLATK